MPQNSRKRISFFSSLFVASFTLARSSFLCFCLSFLCLFFSACSTTKFIPQGKYLLDKVEIHTENPYLNKQELRKYLRQTPNSSVFGVWRMQLHIYNLAGRDSTSWINRVLMKTGEPPVIYSPAQQNLNEQNLQKVLSNKGFMNARVSSTVKTRKKKAQLVFYIDENEPYRLRKYNFKFQNEDLQALASDSLNSLIKENMLFDVDIMDKERERIAKELRKKAYYKFNKDFLIYKADSNFRENFIDVEMTLRDFGDGLDKEKDANTNDSIAKLILTKYYIREVLFSADRNLNQNPNLETTEEEDESMFIRGGSYVLKKTDKNFLRLKTLVENTFILPKTNYSDVDVEKTYTTLTNLAPVKYVNINFKETPTRDSLDCMITLVPTEIVSFTSEIETTYTEGFWGVATNIGTVHRNVFRGAETLSTQGRLAYEWQKGVLAREWGLKAGLLFPNFLLPFTSSDFRYKIRANTEFTTNISYLYRPEEFVVTNVGGGIKYGWKRRRFRHTVELFDLNFVDFDVTNVFKERFLDTNKFNRHNYEDLLISRIAYIGSFSTFNTKRPLRNHSTMHYSLEASGNVFSAINGIFGGKKNANDFYTIIGVPYSQYVRGGYNVTYHQIIDKGNRFVYHFGLGIALPYGNSDVIPYQRRYFSGGANSVRGWSETTLGPGVYKRNSGIRGRDYNQVGDIKLDLNLEYRYKMFGSFDGALFVDAGNIWTIKPYETQVGGEFKFNEFYKQIALAYGIGVRLDLSFVLIRLDWGIKLYNPAQDTNRWTGLPGRRDHAIHLGIGYPF